VAVTTQTSEGIWIEGFRFFGVPLPQGIAHCQLSRDPIWQELQVEWITKSGERHHMPFEQTDEGVKAAIVAMQLTC
jgi:hypothetical protein